MFPFMIKKNRNGLEELQIFIDNRSFSIMSTSPNYVMIKQGIKDNDENAVRKFATIIQNVADWTHGKITIYGNDVFYNGEKVHSSLSRRFVVSFKEGMPIVPIANFLEKLMQNPLKSAHEELYSFLEKCDLPITDDGDFLAYKVVRSDYKDKYTGTMDNSVGAVVKMNREDCNTNRHQTCSSGLHFCSRGYISAFMSDGDHLMVVKVNPMNVVAIPSDYNDQKGRACEYVIHSEIVDADDMPTLSVTDNIDPDDIDLSGYDSESEEEEDDDVVDDAAHITHTSVAGKSKQVANAIPDTVKKAILNDLANKFSLTETAKRNKVSRRSVGRIRDNMG